MVLDQKPFLYLWRPIYRLVFVGIVWPFLGRVKQFFFAETTTKLATLERDIAALQVERQATQTLLATLERDIAALQAEQKEQWRATRALLLSLFRNSTQYSWDNGSDPQISAAEAGTGASAPSNIKTRVTGGR